MEALLKAILTLWQELVGAWQAYGGVSVSLCELYLSFRANCPAYSCKGYIDVSAQIMLLVTFSSLTIEQIA